MDHLRRRQVAFNASSRNNWEAFAEHRQRLTAVLARRAAAGQSRLCVLGAGNTNDLDLTVLLSLYREVHLVDLDSESLVSGVTRQGVANDPRLRLHGGVDVTAALGILSDRTPMADLGRAELDAMAAWPASRTAQALPGGFDRVASTCILSQILETAAHSLGENHHQLDDAQAALRAGHLRLMARLTAPGGEGVLATDVASSKLVAGLPAMTSKELAELLPGLRRKGDYFRATHPSQLLTALRADPTIGPMIASTAQLRPWRWQLHEDTFLVGAITFRLAAP